MDEQQTLPAEGRELKNIIEAALLATDEPLTVTELVALFPEQARPARDQVQRALAVLTDEYEGRGIELRHVGGGYRFQTREQYAPWLRVLFVGRAPRYSRALLETLAIVAYRQPVTRGDIEEIRGVSVSTDIIRTLLNRKWIKQVGHRDVPGHPALFGTTAEFLAYFNLKSLRELPPLMEKRDTLEIAHELNLHLPLEAETNDSVMEEDTEEGAASDAEAELAADVIPLNESAASVVSEVRDADGEREAP